MLPQKKYKYAIGIDTGVDTGYALWDVAGKKLTEVATLRIHEAMDRVRTWSAIGDELLIRVEDARQAIYGREQDTHRLKGAGSVMRDAKIWDDFLMSLPVDFEMIRPRKQFTKLPADKFQRITGYKETTSQHGRDAAMLVYGY